jgi:prepilin-type N-terminal cleavage/methylation domain-containing protein
MPKRIRLHDRQDGFTIVEALVALTIFGIGTIVLMQLAPRATQVANHARNISTANGLAQAKVEELRALPSGHADLMAGVHADPDNPISDHYERQWEVTDDDPIQGMRRVEVQVLITQTASGDSVATLVTYF